MNDDFLLNDNYNNEEISKLGNSTDLDSIFNNLTQDIKNFNKYIDDVNKKKKENTLEEKEILEEKIKLDKAKADFENYISIKNQEYENKMKQADEYLNNQRQILLKTEEEFKSNMDNSLNELELEKKELEIQREKIKEEKEQFEVYKNLELNRLKHSQEILYSEKNQFEKYKEVNNKKIELESKNLEQKCEKFKELIGQFNLKFSPMLEEKE